MAKHRWNYNGDGNLRAGGYYWREDGAEDYVLAVRVTPCPSAGGPSNLFHIESGSIYLPPDPAKRKIALGCCGYAFETATRSEIVDAFMSYCGIDGGDETVDWLVLDRRFVGRRGCGNNRRDDRRQRWWIGIGFTHDSVLVGFVFVG